MKYLDITLSYNNKPILDDAFVPFYAWEKAYLEKAIIPFSVAVEREDGTNLFDCMKKAISFGVPKEQAILSATAIPAEQIGRNEIGVIAPGKLADFVICTEEMDRIAVCIGGARVH